MVFQGWLHQSREISFKASHLSYASQTHSQCQTAVKLHGVFLSCHGSTASSRSIQFRRVLRRDSAQIVTPFVRVGTYPTRNFALFVTPLQGGGGVSHFCRPPYVAAGYGLYLHPSQDGWRVVSEDSRWCMHLLSFPADCLHRTHCHRPRSVAPDTQISQHIASFTRHRYRCEGQLIITLGPL